MRQRKLECVKEPRRVQRQEDIWTPSGIGEGRRRSRVHFALYSFFNLQAEEQTAPVHTQNHEMLALFRYEGTGVLEGLEKVRETQKGKWMIDLNSLRYEGLSI